MYRPVPRPDGRNLEYLELYNSQSIPENLGGFRLSGDIDFAFPEDTFLPPGAFLVVAKKPSDLGVVYGLTNVMGPYAGNLKTSSLIRLRNRANAILLEVSYSNQTPWPAAPDGGGHSLVLARPSLGEGDPLAWSSSDQIGGSPGMSETYPPDPLRSVAINEFLAHSEAPLSDFIELYNHSNQSVDLSGCILSSRSLTNGYLVPPNTLLPARGLIAFTSSQLGFELDPEGGTLYVINPNRTRVLDAIRYEGQANTASMGRSPDGANEFYRLKTATPGALNSEIWISDVVINEIMFRPISGDDDDQYLELYNQGINAVDLGGWKFIAGIDFEFPHPTVMAPGDYLVVARNKPHLLSHYSNLKESNTTGDFSGKLPHNGGRLALASPRVFATTNRTGLVVTNAAFVVEDEVSYQIGGRWGKWADGGGSSLELIQPRTNHRLAANWADSDETTKSDWTTVEHKGVLDNGRSDYAVALQVFLEEAGECLVDDVEVIGPGGTNLVSNGTFENGVSGWVMQGTQDGSAWDTGTGWGGGNCLHIHASGRGDTGANLIRCALVGAGTLSSGTTATIRAKARWLKGCPGLLFRLRGNWLEAAGDLSLPMNLGTPGAKNSRAIDKPGPAIYAVQHQPVMPEANQPVAVTARAHASGSLAQLTVHYRLDPATSYTSVPMVDDGTGGDEVAGDGIFTAALPGQPANKLVAFYVQAAEPTSSAAITRFPADAPEREALIRFGESQPLGSFPVYHLWMTQATATKWTSRLKLHNGPLDTTFVYGNQRAIYNVGACYAGSPFIRPNYTGPTGASCGYSLGFPKDDLFLGVTDVALDWPVRDSAEQSEQVACWMASQLGIPFNYRRFVHWFVNGVRRGAVYEDAQRPNRDFVNEWSPKDDNGDLFKIDDWFEFADNASSFVNINATLQNFTTTGGTKKLARYRWNWRKRADATSANDYQRLFALADALNTPGVDAYTTTVESLVNVDEWMRTFCLEHLVGNWDSYGYNRGKNMYTYKPQDGKWIMLTWDIDFVLGSGGDGPNGSMFAVNDPTIDRMYNHPPFRRAYFRAMLDAVNGPLLADRVNPLLDAHYAALRQNGVAATEPTAVKNYIQNRRNYLVQQLNSVSANFAITSNGGTNFSTPTNYLLLSGTAPVQIQSLLVNGVPYPVTWTTVTSWNLRLPLNAGENLLALEGYDRQGNLYSSNTPTIKVAYTGQADSPSGHLVINEIMNRPAQPGAEYVELFNSSSHTAFDLTGWTLLGLDYTFPSGSLVGPHSFLVLAADRQSFANTYGTAVPVFDTFSAHLPQHTATLSLAQPLGVPGSTDQVVSAVRYQDSAPWPSVALIPGVSLQLIDPKQDSRRVANWAAMTSNSTTASSQWQYVSLTGIATKSILLIGMTAAGDVYLDDIELVAGSVPEAGTNCLRNGDFESSLDGVWTVSTNVLPSAPSTAVHHSGKASLHVVATSGGPRIEQAIWQTTSTLVTNATYTLSYWYLPSTNGSALLVRLSGSSPSSGHIYSLQDYRPSVIASSTATPGTTNSVDATLPAFPPLWINEVQAVNQASTTNRPGEQTGWLELYNAGSNVVALHDFYLANNYTDLTTWAFPMGAAINPGQFKIIFADGQTNRSTLDELHASFNLASGSGAIALSRIYHGRPQVLDFLDYTNLAANHSFGSFPNGQNLSRWEFASPTPGDENRFVNNTAPSLASMADQYVYVGQAMHWQVHASDEDRPPQTLTYSLNPNSPAGVAIDSITGWLTWPAAMSQRPGTNLVSVQVTDNGLPPLSSQQLIAIVVLPAPSFASAARHGTTLHLAWPTAPGKTYRLQYKEDLNLPNWITLGSDWVGDGATISIEVQNLAASARFYRLMVVP
jgi:hypothetical protein